MYVNVFFICTFSGMDGAVYEWDTFTGKRVGESVLKSCSYTSVAITPDGKTTFAVGSDKTLKEVADSQVWHATFIRDTNYKSDSQRRQKCICIFVPVTGFTNR